MLKVRVSEEELAAIRRKAARLRVSPQRLLVESALVVGAHSAPERRALFEEVMVVRRLLAALGNNVNQIARIANSTGGVPPLDAPLDALARTLARADATLDELQAPPA
jgi:Bacterial mobilisation protein (MobC)